MMKNILEDPKSFLKPKTEVDRLACFSRPTLTLSQIWICGIEKILNGQAINMDLEQNYIIVEHSEYFLKNICSRNAALNWV